MPNSPPHPRVPTQPGARQDGAPQHTSQEGRAAAAAQGVVTLLTPPDSPDLNPVEQVGRLPCGPLPYENQ